MQIVIDIPEERFKDIQRIASVQLRGRFETVHQIIAKGTPLPEENTLEEWKKDFISFVDELNMPRDDYNGIIEYINEAPIIIEADRKEE